MAEYGDVKIAINPAVVSESYPISRTEELFAKLSSRVKFAKLGLSDAHQQVQLEPES